MSNNLIGRIQTSYEFPSLEGNEDLPSEQGTNQEGIDAATLVQIIQCSKEISLSSLDNGSNAKPCVGDLFTIKKTDSLLQNNPLLPELSGEDCCLLNIRAQCDFRFNKKKNCFPPLYCLLGTYSNEAYPESPKRLPIKVSSEGITDCFGRVYTFEEVSKLKENELDDLNRAINQEDPDLGNSDFKEGAAEAVVSCILDQKAVVFHFKHIYVLPFEEIKEKRVGRLIDPFITRIQQKFAMYMVRVGVPSTPINVLYETEMKK